MATVLWSDLREEPPDNHRAVRRMLRRAGWVIAAAMVLCALLLKPF